MLKVSVENLHFAYERPDERRRFRRRTPSRNVVFSGASLTVGSSNGQGHVVAVMGPSGSGKSTLLELLCGLLSAELGSIEFAPTNPVVSYLSQEPVLFPHLSPGQNVDFFGNIAAQKRHFDKASLQSAIAVLGLKDVLTEPQRSVNELSGGEQQRLCLARALSIHPQLLLLDEPCTGLDALVKQDFIIRLREIADENKLLVFYTTHHARETLLLADDLVYISRPERDAPATLICGSLKDFIRDPPSIEIAQMFSPGAVNLLTGCSIRNGILYHRANKIGQCTPALGDGNDYTLVFDSNAVRAVPASTDALAVTIMHTSAMHQFAVVDGTADRVVLEEVNLSKVARVRIWGSAYLFSSTGPGTRVNLS